MSAFNIGLSGIRAANTDLSVTGNNIANASTTGFKESRAEFGDLYSNMVFGSAVGRPGSGVSVVSIAQQFEQGNLNGTSNVLDMAIDGEGFFVVDQGGEQMFTRAGNFGLDKEGYVVTKGGAKLQGFGVDTNQNVDGVLGDIRIDASQQAPKQTTGVESALNLDSNEQVIKRVGKTFSTNGGAVGVTQIDRQAPSRTQINTSAADISTPASPVPSPLAKLSEFDFASDAITFEVKLENAASGRNGTVSINLNAANGVPASIDSFNKARSLVNVINAQLSSPTLPESPIDVNAVAVDDGAGQFHIEFRALQEGEPSVLTLSAGPSATPLEAAQAVADGLLLGVDLTAPISNNSGQPAVGNGYPQQSIDITSPDGTVATYTSTENASAAAIASELNALNGVTAKAETEATILGGTDFVNANGNLEITLNGATLTGNDLPSITAQINNLAKTSLPGMSAVMDGANLKITSSLGSDIRITIESVDADKVTVQGSIQDPAQVLTAGSTPTSVTTNGTATILSADFANPDTFLEIDLNGVTLVADTLADLATEINGLTATTLPGITAALIPLGDPAANLVITNASAPDDSLAISISNANPAPGNVPADVVTVQGAPANPAVTLSTVPSTANAANNAIVVGGTLDIQVEQGFTVGNLNPPSLGLFQPFNPSSFTDLVLNPFNPNDPTTYNHTTAVKVYDSLGNDHLMNQYFVKQQYDPEVAGSTQNHWKMMVRIDGRDVGDPDPSLPAPGNTEPSQAEFDMYFNENGELNVALSDTALISNWQPTDIGGNEIGSLGPLNVLNGGVSPVPEPPVSSNFTIDMLGTTQHGSKFSVDAVDQNGYATGRLSGLSIDSEGLIFARFSNQQSTVLGQVALANFTNTQGLQSQGGTTWAETSDSGTPVIGSPRTAALGSIAASSLEDSNVDLSAELVDLIIAQRNYQANAKTIETANQVTQTIINLR